MNIRKLVTFCIIAALTVAAGCVALFGVSWGIYEIRPFARQVVLGADLGGGWTLEYTATASSLPEQVDKAVSFMRARLDNAGYGDAAITRAGSGTVRVNMPVNTSSKTNSIASIAQSLAASALMEVKDGNGKLLFTNADMRRVYMQTVSNKNTTNTNASEYIVMFALNDTATKALAAYSTANPNGKLAMTLDGNAFPDFNLGGRPITNGIAYINAGYAYDNAIKAMQIIQSGPYPTTITLADALQFAPTLGENAYNICAIAIGVLLLAAIIALALRYRLPGLMAGFSLVIFMIALLFTLAAIPSIRLTLPGLLGLLIGVGFALETDVAMFERMRREMMDGRTAHIAIKNGFPRAYNAAFGAQLAVAFIAFMLMFLGNGTVSSLAVMLFIGLAFSLLHGLMTRWLVHLVQFYPVMKKSLFLPERLSPAAKAN